MPTETLNHVSLLANTMDTDNKAPDDEIESVFKNWDDYLSQAKKCEVSAQSDGDLVYAFEQLAVLWAFRAKYDETHDATVQQLAETKNRLEVSDAARNDLEKLFKEPTPIRLVCMPSVGCDGEILSPRPLAILPFHVTCRAVFGQVQCDGDVLP